jgi:suppressor of G2 allele of SKP1
VAAAPASAASGAGGVSSEAPLPGRAGPRLDWYQTASHVCVTVYMKGPQAAGSTVTVTSKLLSLDVALSSGSSFMHDIPLAGTVVAGEAATTYSPTKVEIKLTKDPAHLHNWGTLQATGKAAAAPPPPAAAAAAAAAKPVAATAPGGGGGGGGAMPSAYASKRDWSALEKEIEAEEAAEKPEGDAALRKLFQQIYRNADEDTRRAMVKSYVSRVHSPCF